MNTKPGAEVAGGIFGAQFVDMEGSPLTPEVEPEPEPTDTQKGEGWWSLVFLVLTGLETWLQVFCIALAWEWCVVPAFHLPVLTRFQVLGLLFIGAMVFPGRVREGETSRVKSVRCGQLMAMYAALLGALWLLR